MKKEKKKLTSICFCTFLGLFLGLRAGLDPVMMKMSSSISSFDRAIQNFLFSFFSGHWVSVNPLSRSDFGAGFSPWWLPASCDSPPLVLPFLEAPAPISNALAFGSAGFRGLRFHGFCTASSPPASSSVSSWLLGLSCCCCCLGEHEAAANRLRAVRDPTL